MSRLLVVAALAASSALLGQDASEWVLASRRSGVVEIIDPVTLATVSRIHINLPKPSVGLNGVSASMDGQTLYVEAPGLDDPMGCCILYSIDLATTQMKVAASIPGSNSRKLIKPYRSQETVHQTVKGTAGCAASGSEAVVSAGALIFRYEQFGFKLDRRGRCAAGVPGGVTIGDRQVAPDRHFSELIANRLGSELIGMATEDHRWQRPVELVRIDVAQGIVRTSRTLEADYWRISVAPLRTIPTGDVRAILTR